MCLIAEQALQNSPTETPEYDEKEKSQNESRCRRGELNNHHRLKRNSRIFWVLHIHLLISEIVYNLHQEKKVLERLLK